MKSKTFTVSIVLILFLATPMFAQSKYENTSTATALATLNLILLLNSNNDNGPNEAYQGEMTLKNGELIEGVFSLNNRIFDDEYVVINYTEDDSQSYSTDVIDNIVFYHADDTLTETIYKSENNTNYLLREVYNSDDDVVVYDSSVNPFRETLFGNVYVKEENELIDTWHFWSSGPKHDLIRYVRNKDGVRYKRKTFKSLKDVYAKL
ncbi:hypothetical protein [Lacinutrix chionoecetis]